jgi:hypothetical protein
MSPDVGVKAGHMMKLFLEGKWVVNQVLSIKKSLTPIKHCALFLSFSVNFH